MMAGIDGGAGRDLMRWLLAMPMLHAGELAAVSGLPRASAFRTAGRLINAGLVNGVSAAMPGGRKSARLYLTGMGLAVLASEMGVATVDLLRRYPVSAHGLRLLLARLDTVAAVYRLASELAGFSPVRRFAWYRKLPLDAGIELADGRVVGVIREGPIAALLHLMRRADALARGRHPDTLLVLAPDAVRVREWRQRLAKLPFRSFLAVEAEVLAQRPGSARWHASFDPKPYELAEVVRLSVGGRLPAEAAPRRTTLPPVDLVERAQKLQAAQSLAAREEYLQPLALDGGEKLLLHTLALWPLASISDLMGLLGMARSKVVRYLRLPRRLGLVEEMRIERRARYAPSDRGLALLARRDRVSVQRLVRRWSPRSVDGAQGSALPKVRGSRLGDLLRHFAHTAAVYGFWASLARQVREAGGSVITLQPPHYAQRWYAERDHVRTLRPDGYAHYRINGKEYHCFLEWEQRAVNPFHFRTKLRPYHAYFANRSPLDDHGAFPVLLVVLRDEVTEANFLAFLRRDHVMPRGANLVVLATYVSLTQAQGALGPIWKRSPGEQRTSLAVGG